MDGLPYGCDFTGVTMGHLLGTYQLLTGWIPIRLPIWDSGCRMDTGSPVGYLSGFPFGTPDVAWTYSEAPG
eukprot:14360445-Ditylum_brightwellii.AAC.1